MEIRDPVHGPVAVSTVEVAVVDSPWFQRLRSIKQLGFSEQTFPGASHTRFLHSIGAMHLAGKAFDAVFRNATWLTGDDRERLRQTLRLAALYALRPRWRALTPQLLEEVETCLRQPERML